MPRFCTPRATSASKIVAEPKILKPTDAVIRILSERSGVHVETIRYYERIGVLPQPDRAHSGRRTYREADAERLAFVRHARDLGFDLQAVRNLLALQQQPEASCAEASHIAQAELVAVEDRIERLLRLRDELRRMVGECKVGRVSDCQVIEALTERSS